VLPGLPDRSGSVQCPAVVTVTVVPTTKPLSIVQARSVELAIAPSARSQATRKRLLAWWLAMRAWRTTVSLASSSVGPRPLVWW
jgi:hypothetical protein